MQILVVSTFSSQGQDSEFKPPWPAEAILSKDMHVRLIGDYKFAVGVNTS